MPPSRSKLAIREFDISEFESHMPSHAVGLCRQYFQLASPRAELAGVGGDPIGGANDRVAQVLAAIGGGGPLSESTPDLSTRGCSSSVEQRSPKPRQSSFNSCLPRQFLKKSAKCCKYGHKAAVRFY